MPFPVQELVVQKYGGTSVGSLAHIERVAAHIEATRRGGASVVVTISAMGEQTDELLAMARALNPQPPRREVDMLLTAGERMSAALLAIALDRRQVPSVSLTGSQCGILTDATHGNARITRILGDRIRASLGDRHVVIVAGFQGVNPHTKDITTLGRGGTDLTAVAIAAALKAERCELYKDVRGVFSADPRLVRQARLIKRLSFGSMTALAWGGANVLHPRSAHIALKYGVPFSIRSSAELDEPGTSIESSETLKANQPMESPLVEALAHKVGMSLVTSSLSPATPETAAAIAEALDWLWDQGESPALSCQTLDPEGRGSLQLTQVIKSNLADGYTERLKRLASGSSRSSLKRRVDGLATIAIVGKGFQQSPESVRQVCSALPTAPQMMATSDTVINLCILESDLGKTMDALHRALIESRAG